MIGFKTKDIDVIKFIKAAGITGGTEFSAVNYLVIALKNKNLWDKIIALYPFVGSTATAHKYNLKDPRDVNAAFRIVWAGGVTHDSNGVTFDGVNGYGDTWLIPSTSMLLGNESMFLYSRTSAAATATGWDMGAANTITQRDTLILRTPVDNITVNINSTSAGAGSLSFNNTSASGFFIGSRISQNDLRIYKNGTQIGTTATVTNNGTRSNLSVLIGARRISSGPNGFVARNFALAGLGRGFTNTQANDFYDIVQQYQTILNRQV